MGSQRASFRRVLGLIVMVVLVPLGGTACASVAAGDAKCAVNSDNPHPSSGTPGSIVGKARFGCDHQIDSVTAAVKIQEMSNGTWQDVTAPSNRTMESPVPNMQYIVQAALLCAPGTFRTASQGYGFYGGVRSESTAWDYSQTVTDPCG